MGPGWLTSWDHLTSSRTSGSPTGCGPWIPSQGFGGLEEGEVGVSSLSALQGWAGLAAARSSTVTGPVMWPSSQDASSHLGTHATRLPQPLPLRWAGAVGISISYYSEEAPHTSK